jgi:hypothetical protein
MMHCISHASCGSFSNFSYILQNLAGNNRVSLLVQVRVHEFAHYHSLPLKIVGRIIPGNGTTQQGRHLLKTRIDRFRVVKLCREFARNHGGH